MTLKFFGVKWIFRLSLNLVTIHATVIEDMDKITNATLTFDCERIITGAVVANRKCLLYAGQDQTVRCDCVSLFNETVAPCKANFSKAGEISSALVQLGECLKAPDMGSCPAIVSMAIRDHSLCYAPLSNVSTKCACDEKLNQTVAMCASDSHLPASLQSLLRTLRFSDTCQEGSLAHLCDARSKEIANQLDMCKHAAQQDDAGYNETRLCECLYRFDSMPLDCDDVIVSQTEPYAQVQPKCGFLLPGMASSKSCINKVRDAGDTLRSCSGAHEDDLLGRCSCLEAFNASTMSTGMCTEYAKVKREIMKTWARYEATSAQCALQGCTERVADASSSLEMCITGAARADGEGQNRTGLCKCLESFNATVLPCKTNPLLRREIESTMSHKASIYPQCEAILHGEQCSHAVGQAKQDFDACAKLAETSVVRLCSCANAFKHRISECRNDSAIRRNVDQVLGERPQLTQCSGMSQRVQCVTLVRGSVSELAACRRHTLGDPDEQCACTRTFNETVAPCSEPMRSSINEALDAYGSPCKGYIPAVRCGALVVPALQGLHLCTSTAGDDIDAMCHCVDTFNESVRECTDDPSQGEKIHQVLSTNARTCANSRFQDGEQVKGTMSIQVNDAQVFIADPNIQLAIANGIASLAKVPRAAVSVTLRGMATGARRLEEPEPASERVQAAYTIRVPHNDARSGSEVAADMSSKRTTEVGAFVSSAMQAEGVTNPVAIRGMSSAAVATTTTDTTNSLTSGGSITTTTTAKPGGVPHWVWFVFGLIAVCLMLTALAVVFHFMGKASGKKKAKKSTREVVNPSDQVPLVAAQTPSAFDRLDGVITREEFMRQVVFPMQSMQRAQVMQPIQPQHPHGPSGQQWQPQPQEPIRAYLHTQSLPMQATLVA